MIVRADGMTWVEVIEEAKTDLAFDDDLMAIALGLGRTEYGNLLAGDLEPDDDLIEVIEAVERVADLSALVRILPGAP